MAMARMRRACLASAVRAASARNCEILRSWRVISIAVMMPTPRIIDVLHRVTFADGWESHRSQVLRRLVSYKSIKTIRPDSIFFDETLCHAYLYGNGVLYFNYSHLSIAGAEMLVKFIP